MLVDADGVGQDDGRTERGRHVRATGWRHRYRRMTWVWQNPTNSCAVIGGNTIYQAILILLPWNTGAKAKPPWNHRRKQGSSNPT